MRVSFLRTLALAGIACAGSACATAGNTTATPVPTPVTSNAETTPATAVTETVPPPATEPAYVPKTAHDNTPYRFDMNQNGKRMSAAEFDAWMQSRGIRVATGKPAETAPATASAPATPAPTAATVVACVDSAPKDC